MICFNLLYPTFWRSKNCPWSDEHSLYWEFATSQLAGDVVKKRLPDQYVVGLENQTFHFDCFLWLQFLYEIKWFCKQSLDIRKLKLWLKSEKQTRAQVWQNLSMISMWIMINKSTFLYILYVMSCKNLNLKQR